MFIAPIIHSRTLRCDYNPNFLVRPIGFPDECLRSFKEDVLLATTCMELAQDERFMVVDYADYRVAGIVGFIDNICSKSKLTPKEKEELLKMVYDENDRRICVFVGVVMDKNKKYTDAFFSYDFFSKLYLNNVSPIWDRSISRDTLTDFQDISSENSNEYDVPTFKKIGGKCYYECSPESDFKLFNYFVSYEGKVAFCSNIGDLSIINRCSFLQITTTRNAIGRVEKGGEKGNCQNCGMKGEGNISNKEMNFDNISELIKYLNEHCKHIRYKGKKVSLSIEKERSMFGRQDPGVKLKVFYKEG